MDSEIRLYDPFLQLALLIVGVLPLLGDEIGAEDIRQREIGSLRMVFVNESATAAGDERAPFSTHLRIVSAWADDSTSTSGSTNSFELPEEVGRNAKFRDALHRAAGVGHRLQRAKNGLAEIGRALLARQFLPRRLAV